MKLSTLLRSILLLVMALLARPGWAFLDNAVDKSRWGQVPDRTVVLVHGAFADGSCWSEVIRLLQAAGVKVVSVQNPLTSLAADVIATQRVINQQGTPVVLVGHSWGGMVITEAGNHPKVSSLVYVAAFAPDVGSSAAALLQPYPPAPWLADTVADEAGNLTLSQPAFLKYFVPDLPVRQAKALWAVQVPTFHGTLVEPVTQAAWRSKPSWFVIAEKDGIIHPDLQRATSARMKARVTSLRSGHVPMLSQPYRVAAVILDAVRAR